MLDRGVCTERAVLEEESVLRGLCWVGVKGVFTKRSVLDVRSLLGLCWMGVFTEKSPL